MALKIVQKIKDGAVHAGNKVGGAVSTAFNTTVSTVGGWIDAVLPTNLKELVELIRRAVSVIESALPVVKALDQATKDLKLDGSDYEKRLAIWQAIHGVAMELGSDKSLASRVANETWGMAIQNALATAAEALLRSRVPAGVPTSIIKFSIEAAYNIYKIKRELGAKDEDRTSVREEAGAPSDVAK